MKHPATFKIGSHDIGYGKPVFIIAEAGVNHNGRLDLALKLVDAAAKAGADAVKFQTFKAEEVVTAQGEMASYQKKNLKKTESQLAMLRKLQLPEKYYAAIKRRCREKGIIFMTTPHGGFGSVDFVAKLKVPAFKFGSGDLTNLPVLAHAARYKLPMILGTGMATLEEVRDAIKTIHRAGNKNVVALHCTSNYPCPPEEVNLRAMKTMMEKLPALVGYSDHTREVETGIMATAMGACVIEKHFTLKRSMPGPDHKASLEPDELARMVTAIRETTAMLGSSIKGRNKSEDAVAPLVRKSVVTIRPVKKGERFTDQNLGIKRPGTGLAPARYLDILGKTAKRDIANDTLLRPHDF